LFVQKPYIAVFLCLHRLGLPTKKTPSSRSIFHVRLCLAPLCFFPLLLLVLLTHALDTLFDTAVFSRLFTSFHVWSGSQQTNSIMGINLSDATLEGDPFIGLYLFLTTHHDSSVPPDPESTLFSP